MTAIKGFCAPLVPAVSQSMLARLLVRPLRGLQESVGGHWLRVAHSNGLADPKCLLEGNNRSAMSIVRICPACLSSPDAFWSEDWMDRCKPFCRVHGQWLMDRCSACDRLLRWNRLRFLACSCRQDLRELTATALPPQTVRLLHTGSASVAVLLWLGALSRYGLTMKPLKKAARVSMSEVMTLADAGAQVVSGWPNTFFDVLGQCRLDTTAPGGLSSMNEALPGLSSRLRKLGDGPWQELIAIALGDYVAASHRSEAPIVGRNLIGDRPQTVAQIARVLRVRTESLIAALDRLPAVPGARRTTAQGRSRRLIPSDAIWQVQQLLSDEISVKASARIIGLSTSRIRQLIATGLLNMYKRCLSRIELHGLLQSLLSSGRPVTARPDVISLSHALRYTVPVQLTARFLQAVLERDLILFVPEGAVELAGCLINQDRCQRWVTEQGHQDDAALPLPTCALLLGLKQQVIYHLAHIGLISVHTARTSRGRFARVATMASVDQFQRRFVALARLARESGVDHRGAVNWANTNGIALVSGPSIDGGRQYFALRPTQSLSGRGSRSRLRSDQGRLPAVQEQPRQTQSND